jgi:hypothetical protein
MGSVKEICIRVAHLWFLSRLEPLSSVFFVEGTASQFFGGHQRYLFCRLYVHFRKHICLLQCASFIHTYVHTYICIHIHTYLCTSIHTYVHRHIHMYIYTYVQTYIRMYIDTYVCTSIHTYVHTYIHTYVHTYMHTYIHTYIQTYILRVVLLRRFLFWPISFYKHVLQSHLDT